MSHNCVARLLKSLTDYSVVVFKLGVVGYVAIFKCFEVLGRNTGYNSSDHRTHGDIL